MDELAKVLEVNEKEDYLPFIDILESFKDIVETCFGFTFSRKFKFVPYECKRLISTFPRT